MSTNAERVNAYRKRSPAYYDRERKRMECIRRARAILAALHEEEYAELLGAEYRRAGLYVRPRGRPSRDKGN